MSSSSWKSRGGTRGGSGRSDVPLHSLAPLTGPGSNYLLTPENLPHSGDENIIVRLDASKKGDFFFHIFHKIYLA